MIHISFNQVTRLREYQGVDPHFDTIARQYHDIIKVTTMLTVVHYLLPVCKSNINIPLQKLENMQWTIHQVEMDLKRLPDHANA